MINNYLPTKASKKRCFLLIGLLLSLYLVENSPITKYLDNQILNYILKPMLWGSMALIVWIFPKIRSKGLLKLKGLINIWAFNFSIIFIVISVIAGVIDGLGKSPYDHSLRGMLLNILLVGSMLIGREFVRSYIVNSLTKEENYVVFVLVALFMTFISISLNRYFKIDGYVSGVKFTAQYFAPEFSKNLFASYLVFLGGPIASIIYLGVLEAFHWLSPILPDLKWIITALIGVLCPIFSLLAMQSIYLNQSKEIKVSDKEEDSPISWMITSIVSIGIIWFAVGVFPVYPSVIATGSMEPMIKPGDVILVKKIVDIEGVKKLDIDDVIQFKRGNILISHRIKEIVEKEKEGIQYKTKGDNNSVSDSKLVKPEQIKGKIVKVVPKIGWPTLLIKSKDDIPLDQIEF
ncbi:MAG: signal peptidase I [Firmicutes bacterium]|nr:signal peptidase I [Bacillota bacterium]